MKKSQMRRVAKLAQSGRASTQETEGSLLDFAAALREARRRVAAGETIPQIPITQEMIEDPVYGQFWRRMHEARERVRLLQNPSGSIS